MKLRVLNLALKHLFNAVVLDDVLVVKGSRVYIAGQELTKGHHNSLKQDHVLLDNCELYNLTKKHLRHQAHKKIYNDAVTTDDIVFGKAMLHNLNLMSEFVSKFK